MAALKHCTALRYAGDMADKELTSTDVVRALVAAKAVGKLTVSGDNPVIITGSDQDKERARTVLKGQGLALTPYPERDEWTS